MNAPIKAILLLATLCFHLGPLDHSQLYKQRQGPLIGIDRVAIDFGVMGANAIAEHTYTIYNFGDAPLYVKRIEVSCGCTAGNVGKKMIMPQDSTALEVRFEASKKGIGKVQNFISVQSNSRVSPDTVLSFTAFVAEDSMASIHNHTP